MLFRLLATICVFLGLAACSPDTRKDTDKAGTARTEEKEQTKAPLRLGVMASMDYLPLAVAKREGYFDQAELNLDMQVYYSANDRDAAFHSGNLDGMVVDYTGALIQFGAGVDIRLTSRCDATFFLVAGSHSGATTLEELQGKTVAVSQNTVIDYFVDMALASAGLGPESVVKTEVNKIPVRFELLQNGKIDATGLPNPLALVAEHAGGPVLATNTDMGISVTGIAFSGKAMQNRAEDIKKLYLSYNRGVDYLAAHPASDIKDVLMNFFGFPEHLVDAISFDTYKKAALPEEKSILSVQQWLQARELVPPGLDGMALLDGSFLPQ